PRRSILSLSGLQDRAGALGHALSDFRRRGRDSSATSGQQEHRGVEKRRHTPSNTTRSEVTGHMPAHEKSSPFAPVRWPAQLLLAVVLLTVIYELAEIAHLGLRPERYIPLWRSLSLLVIWRWGWAAVHWTRAVVYRFIVYPRLVRQARAAVS